MHTVGDMRTWMLVGAVLASAFWIWLGSLVDLAPAMVGACWIGLVVGWVGALATSRLPQSTPLVGLKIGIPSTVVFLLSISAFQTLVLQPVVGGVLCVVILPAGWWLLRRSRTAVSEAHHDLMPSGGDLSFGIYTALTPLQTPSNARSDLDDSNSTLLDPDGGRDPATDWSHRRRSRE